MASKESQKSIYRHHTMSPSNAKELGFPCVQVRLNFLHKGVFYLFLNTLHDFQISDLIPTKGSLKINDGLYMYENSLNIDYTNPKYGYRYGYLPNLAPNLKVKMTTGKHI